MTVTKPSKPVPMNVMFKNLESNSAFISLMESMDKMIKSEEEKFWQMDKQDSEPQRIKIQAYKEFKNKMSAKITNSKMEKK